MTHDLIMDNDKMKYCVAKGVLSVSIRSAGYQKVIDLCMTEHGSEGQGKLSVIS